VPRRGRLDGYSRNPFTRAFPRGAAWASAPGAWPDWPQFPRSSRDGQSDHLLIFPCLLPLPVSRESASLTAPSVPGGRPRQQAAAGYSSPTESETRPSGSFRPGWSDRRNPSAPLGWYGSIWPRAVAGLTGALRAGGYARMPSMWQCKYCLTFQIRRVRGLFALSANVRQYPCQAISPIEIVRYRLF
jgi:hypothetical protein